ncbi:pyrroline-5-carboxylate reductase [Arenibacter sp. GZD96]|uniref:pyrroline-5-carboxylate reductase n=1 Tax=Aurantibrevibacter litoralis TaxID=3106030 RepID=UPI002AFF4C8B|nr:pyrroline-5-carboxylate reductase [Arenibacter sp. GZD-96]MEA1787531.1 pyrroline-5-carboxylate reductase [Arenibacter sp. GZD-96]
MKVLVIGAGNMGLTYAEAMSKSRLLRKRNIMVLDTSEEKRNEIDQITHFDAHEHLNDCVPQADIIFVAVKPYHAIDLFKTMRTLVNSQQILISIMAGVTINTIMEATGLTKVVRAMPNLPAKVGMGLTSYFASPAVSHIELLTVESLLETTGKAILVSNENYIDASTGISGSGPAYVFYFMQSMMEAASQMGFSENVSRVLVSQTFTGAVELFNQSDLSPNSWMNKVASKGGTTRAALDSMEDNNVKELIKEAAYAAFSKAVALGKDR